MNEKVQGLEKEVETATQVLAERELAVIKLIDSLNEKETEIDEANR
jgi:hypothetical protein